MPDARKEVTSISTFVFAVLTICTTVVLFILFSCVPIEGRLYNNFFLFFLFFSKLPPGASDNGTWFALFNNTTWFIFTIFVVVHALLSLFTVYLTRRFAVMRWLVVVSPLALVSCLMYLFHYFDWYNVVRNESAWNIAFFMISLMYTLGFIIAPPLVYVVQMHTLFQKISSPQLRVIAATSLVNACLFLLMIALVAPQQVQTALQNKTTMSILAPLPTYFPPQVSQKPLRYITSMGEPALTRYTSTGGSRGGISASTLQYPCISNALADSMVVLSGKKEEGVPPTLKDALSRTRELSAYIPQSDPSNIIYYSLTQAGNREVIKHTYSQSENPARSVMEYIFDTGNVRTILTIPSTCVNKPSDLDQEALRVLESMSPSL